MRRRLLLESLMVPAIASTLPAVAQGTEAFAVADLSHAELLRERSLKDAVAYSLVSSLVREVGPRPAGSAADARAVQWALARLQSLGFGNVRAEEMPLQVWQRGPCTVTLLAPGPQPLVAAALGNSRVTLPDGLEGEVVYYPDFAALKSDTGDRARGRIVFVDQKMESTRDGSGYGPAGRSRYYGPAEAARRGALAFVIRSVGTDNDPVAHTGATDSEANVSPVPGVAVSIPDADRVAALHAAGTPLRMRVQVEAKVVGGLTSHNVIAEVPGGDLAEEIVLLGAHLDSWDISPGAIDDGAGVALVTAAAKAVLDGGRKPRRTIRVVLFANEENGFDGAKAYAQRYASVRHQMVAESDTGAERVWRMRSRVAPQALPAISAIAGLLRPLGIDAPGNDGTPGADAGILMRAHGWPAMELTQDASRYFDVHHTANDTLDRIDAAALPQAVAAWATLAWLAAQSRAAFGPLEGNGKP